MQKDAMQPLVTVVIPTIGRPKYIVDTVRSVLSQDYRHVQVLISDNAPTVATAGLLAEAGISDERIEIVVRPQRLGFSAHMNACIGEARGEHVMIVSDDDQIEPGYVGEMSGLLASRPDVAACLGRQIQITENDAGLIRRDVPAKPQHIVDGLEFLEGTLSGTLKTGVLTYISLFARRADILRVGGFKLYPDGSHADNYILLSLAMQGKVALGSKVMFYRVYLASFGLSTPFSALMVATRAYTRDGLDLLHRQHPTAPRAKAVARLMITGNFRLLLNRLRNVYRHRMSLPRFAWSLMQTGMFLLAQRWTF